MASTWPTRFLSRLSVLPLALGLALPLAAGAQGWVASWTAPPQPTWGADFALPTGVPAQLHDQTVRQVARLSLGGTRLRLVFSNAYGQAPLVLGTVRLALPAGGAAIVPGSDRAVTFNGQPRAIIPPGGALTSDPVALAVPALGRVAVSVHLPDAVDVSTFHWDGRQTAFLGAGDQAAAERLVPQGDPLTARLLLAGIEVGHRAPAAVVAIGDSITDGNGASIDADTRWPDFLAARLAPRGVAVLNAGISGARLLADGMGERVLARFERDVLAQPGVRSVVVLVGINDISWPGTAFAPQAPRPWLDALTAGYRQLAERAHARGVRIVGATLTPFEGALAGTPLADYYQPGKEALRQQLNAWIRDSGSFDAVLDFDAWSRDPAHPTRFAAAYDSGDHLHPGDEGNRRLAEAIDLGLLLGPSPAPARRAQASIGRPTKLSANASRPGTVPVR